MTPSEPPKPESGPNRTFVERFAANQQRILGYIATLVPNWQDAEDVFQKTSIVLWEKYDQFDPSRDFLSWACGVAFFEVRNFYRVDGRDRLRFSDETMKELADFRAQSPKNSSRSVALQRCLKKLPADDRQLVLQAYESRGSVKAMAERLGRSVQTLYNRLNKIRRGLFDCVDRALAEEGES